MQKYARIQTRLNELKKGAAHRAVRTLDSKAHMVSDGVRELINFSSNDYLGLAADLELQQHFFKQNSFNQQHWMSASSSRALTGTSSSHATLEKLIAKSYNKTNALLFNSGYHANTGILPALTTEQDLIITDKLVHASLIDGLKLSRARFKRFAHNDLNHLKQILNKHRDQYRDVWIVTESLFSMDGDLAPLTDLVSLKNEYQCHLYIDEAHAVGCYGQNGLGLSETNDVISDIDILVGTFGKALASCGGFAVGDTALIETLINNSRSWLFSTALPPINMDWNLFIWQQLSTFTEQRSQLEKLTKTFRDGLKSTDHNALGNTFIVPIVITGNKAVVAHAKRMEDYGVLALPIRSPTVRRGSERIRFSLTANLPDDAIQSCFDILNAI